MSYAINADGNGCRAINDESDLKPGDVFSATEPVLVLPAAPDMTGFIADMKTAFGDIVAIASIPHYATFMDALKMGEWDDVAALLTNALSNSSITAQQYADFQAAFSANNIPVSLP